MSFEWYWAQFLFALPHALPWILGGLAGVAMVSFGPVGRALTHRLRRGAEEAERLESVLEELALLRGELGEALERLDYTRGPALGNDLSAGHPPSPPSTNSEKGVTTPV